MSNTLEAAITIPIDTYSIVARDPETGELGVAVQSHFFAVGAVCAWAEAGVGAIATQAFGNPAYGKLGLDLMRAGRSADDALRELLNADNGRELRQVAMIGATGEAAVHTGQRTIEAAGHIVGAGYSVQANMMLNDSVWPAMAKSFDEAVGDLTERMMIALEAAELAGGDIRGRQSAALLVVGGERSDRPWDQRTFDLRVDDHPEPLAELRRLIAMRRGYLNMEPASLGRDAHKTETQIYEAARAASPHNPELAYWRAVALAVGGKIDEALPLFREVFAIDRNWIALTRRIVKAGLLPDDAALIEKIVSQG